MGSLECNIYNCYSNVDIYSPEQVKNVAGFLNITDKREKFTIKNCFAIGDIETTADNMGGFSSCILSSQISNIFSNIYRSDNNLFSEGSVFSYGQLIQLSQFYLIDFYRNNNIFNEYESSEYLGNNSNAVWVLSEGELPKLYWEK